MTQSKLGGQPSRPLLVAAALAAFGAGTSAAQAPMRDMPGMDHTAPAAVSAKAQKEIATAAKAAAPLGIQSNATSAGFKPVFGWLPTMGVHWVDQSRMVKDKQSDIAAPDNLMFSKIAGKDSLVGAAYAYFGPVADSTRPLLFDGAPPWHEHANLAPPGQTLVMLHVWFVPSPDGPFAGTNPNLPFWAAGFDAPDAARMHDAAFSSRVRRASLALAEVIDTTSIFPNLESRPAVHAVLVVRRDSVRALMPQLLAAQTAKDPALWDRVADRLAAQWDAMQTAYYDSALVPAGKERMERFIAMLMGEHVH
jgi:hypothetical protein